MSKNCMTGGVLLAAILLAASPLRGQTFSVFPVERFYETVNYRFAGFSSDESKVLVSSDKSGIFNVHSIGIADGADTQLTQSKGQSFFAIGYFPKDDRILYTADQGGNELNHVFVRELDGSQVDLTPGEKLKAIFLGWHDDDRGFYIATNERDPKTFDLYRYEDAKGEKGAKEPYPRKLIFQNDAVLRIAAVSQNGRFIVFERLDTQANNDIVVLDVEGKKPPKVITEHKGDILHHVQAFAPDNRTLWYSCDKESEWQRTWIYDTNTEKHRQLIDLERKYDTQSISFARNGRFRVVSMNKDAQTETTVTDLRNNLPLELPEDIMREVVDVGFSKTASTLALIVASDVLCPDIHIYKPGGKETKKITKSMPDEMDPYGLVSSMAVSFESWDGLSVPALLYKPLQAGPDRKSPALIWVHGGPGGQSRQVWNPDLQALVNRGYAVFAVNNRGSSGYGKTFYHKDDRKHGEDDLKDLVAAKKYLADFDWIDRNKIGVLGGSYGGYLVTAALAFQPDAFDAGVDLFGVTNWVRTLKSMPPWWEAQRKSLYKELGDPAVDEKRLTKISTLFSADKIKKPLFVVQGANDPRVLKAESDELVAAVKKSGAVVEYLVFDDEGHGFTKKENRIACLSAIYKFLEKNLRKK